MTAAEQAVALAMDELDVWNGVREAVHTNQYPDARLRTRLLRERDPVLLRRVGRLLDRPELVGDDLRPIRVSVLAPFTIGSFTDLLRAYLVGAGLAPTLQVAQYGSFDLALATGEFPAHQPDLVVLLLDESVFLPTVWSPVDVDDLTEQVQRRLDDFCSAVTTSAADATASVVLHTVPLPAEVRDSFIAARDRAVVAGCWHRLNATLLDLSRRHPRVLAVDLVGALADTPFAVRDDRLHRYGDLPYSDGALSCLAREVRRVAQASTGSSRKVLALDLDNTLWGGVVGEVGAEGVTLGGLYPGNAYRQVQRAAQRLREQGVVLVLTSKNDTAVATDAMMSHPEMLLRPDAFSYRAVNWSSKAENLRAAAAHLGLSTAATVFLDDSPFERGQVSGSLPEVAVLPADGDPARLVRTLLEPGWFDTLDLTETDRRRPELYRGRAERSTFSTGFGSSQDYLRALGIHLAVEPANRYTAARVAQLAARTNQFNLTGVRFDQPATTAMAADPGYLVAACAVTDRFGDEGVVGAVWVCRGAPTWEVLNLVLSCRVLGRGVELAIVGWLVRQARLAGAAAVEGRYTPTAKNGAARDFWTRAGFTAVTAELYRLDLRGADDPTPDWISTEEPQQHG